MIDYREWHDQIAGIVDDATVASDHVNIQSSDEPCCGMNIQFVFEDEDIPFTDVVYTLPHIKAVVFDGNGTAIHWMDGSRTHVRCMAGEKFDRYGGFMAAVCKKLFGSTTAAKRLMNEKDAAIVAQKRREEIAKHQAEQHEREIRNLTREINRMVKRKRMEMVADAIIGQGVKPNAVTKYLKEGLDEEDPHFDTEDNGENG